MKIANLGQNHPFVTTQYLWTETFFAFLCGFASLRDSL